MTARLLLVTIAACAASPPQPRPTLVEVSATWCAACRLLDRDALAAPVVTAELARFARAFVDASDDDARARELGVAALPTLILIDSTGAPAGTVVGTISADQLAARLRAVR